MLKTYNKPERAMRYGVSMYVGLYDGSGDANYTTTNQVNLTLIVGKEFQEKIGRMWIWYYGMDVMPAVHYSRFEYFIDDQRIRQNTSINYGVTARPFLGIRFNINERLYVSTEANFNAAYRHSKSTNKIYQPPSTEKLSGNGFSLAVEPATGIFIFYRFKK
jgi:hypothetical protein